MLLKYWVLVNKHRHELSNVSAQRFISIPHSELVHNSHLRYIQWAQTVDLLIPDPATEHLTHKSSMARGPWKPTRWPDLRIRDLGRIAETANGLSWSKSK